MRIFTTLSTFVLFGCSSTTLPAVPPTDAPAADAVIPGDAPVAQDVGAQDASPGADATPGTDASTGDAVSVSDGAIGDASTGPSLVGRWRATRWSYTPDGGTTVTVNDTDTPVVTDPMTGRTTLFRVNGILSLSPTRISMAEGVVAGGHFYATQDATGADAYSAYGFTVPGVYNSAAQTFAYPGSAMPMRMHVMDADHFSIGEGGAAMTVFTRATGLRAGIMTVNTQCAAQKRHPLASAALAHPRVGFIWDVPSSGAARPESLGYALTFTAAYAGFPVTLAASPDAAVIQVVDGARVASGHPIVYDDLNEDGRYTPMSTPPDQLRGVGSIAIVWVDPARAATLDGTRFSDLIPGYQFVHLHPDFARGTDGFAPFDTTTEVCADVPVEDTAITSPIPNVFR